MKLLFTLSSILLVSTLTACSSDNEPIPKQQDSNKNQQLDNITLTTSWYAEAEHGGYYEAQAKGIYKKYGLNVTIKQGGPQINGMTLLVSKKSDIIVGYDMQVLKSVEEGMPVTAIGASFQYDPQGIITHDNVNSLADLKGKTILISTSAQTSFWPWLKVKYGLTDEQVRPYTFNLQPFLANKNTVQQGFATSEVLPATQADPTSKFFLLADYGYPPYGGTIITRNDMIKNNPDVLKRFMQATSEGWKEYLKDPTPANAIIKKENPQMTDEILNFAVNEMKKRNFLTGGDAKTMGIGVITEERWKKTRDMMVSTGLLKADTPWQQAFTVKFVAPQNALSK